MRNILIFTTMTFLAVGLFGQTLTKDELSRFEKSLNEIKDFDEEYIVNALGENIDETSNFILAIDATFSQAVKKAEIQEIIKKNGFTNLKWQNTAKKVIGIVLYLYFTSSSAMEELNTLREELENSNPEEIDDYDETHEYLTSIDGIIEEFANSPDISEVKSYLQSFSSLLGIEIFGDDEDDSDSSPAPENPRTRRRNTEAKRVG